MTYRNPFEKPEKPTENEHLNEWVFSSFPKIDPQEEHLFPLTPEQILEKKELEEEGLLVRRVFDPSVFKGVPSLRKSSLLLQPSLKFLRNYYEPKELLMLFLRHFPDYPAQDFFWNFTFEDREKIREGQKHLAEVHHVDRENAHIWRAFEEIRSTPKNNYSTYKRIVLLEPTPSWKKYFRSLLYCYRGGCPLRTRLEFDLSSPVEEELPDYSLYEVTPLSAYVQCAIIPFETLPLEPLPGPGISFERQYNVFPKMRKFAVVTYLHEGEEHTRKFLWNSPFLHIEADERVPKMWKPIGRPRVFREPVKIRTKNKQSGQSALGRANRKATMAARKELEAQKILELWALTPEINTIAKQMGRSHNYVRFILIDKGIIPLVTRESARKVWQQKVERVAQWCKENPRDLIDTLEIGAALSMKLQTVRRALQELNINYKGQSEKTKKRNLQ